MKDAQAEHERFEELVGGPQRGFRLLRLYVDSRAVKWPNYPARSRVEVFWARALRDGYTDEQVKTFLRLQG